MKGEEWQSSAQFIHKPLLPVQDVGARDRLPVDDSPSKKGSSAVHHWCENKFPHSEKMDESTECTTFASF